MLFEPNCFDWSITKNYKWCRNDIVASLIQHRQTRGRRYPAALLEILIAGRPLLSHVVVESTLHAQPGRQDQKRSHHRIHREYNARTD